MGQRIEVPSDKCSLGGKGSGAELELSGTPHGVEFGALRNTADGWLVSESKPRTLLLNDKRFKRKNVLKNGDVLKLPSLAKGQAIRYQIEVAEKAKKKTVSNPLAELNPTIVAGVGAYLMMMLLAFGYFFFFYSPADSGVSKLDVAALEEALDEDVSALMSADLSSVSAVALNESPASVSDLKKFLKSAQEDETAKQDYVGHFKTAMMDRFAEAWRLEQQGRFEEAETHYQTILSLLGDRHLQTTQIALERLQVTRLQ